MISAPFGACLLADIGADVVKVEHPKGDPLREWSPKKEERSLWWKIKNRNKRLVCLHLHDRRRSATTFPRWLCPECWGTRLSRHGASVGVIASWCDVVRLQSAEFMDWVPIRSAAVHLTQVSWW